MRNLFLIIITFAFPLFAFTQSSKKLPKRFKLPNELVEVSGLYIENSNSFWWHNDSGSRPQLFQTNAKGKLINTISFDNIKNTDWEDLTYDDQGNIYIGDFGNNRNKRKDFFKEALVIFLFGESSSDCFLLPNFAIEIFRQKY